MLPAFGQKRSGEDRQKFVKYCDIINKNFSGALFCVDKGLPGYYSNIWKQAALNN